MADQLWVVTTGSTALVAATAKTVIEVATGAAISNTWPQFDISFNGASGSAVPVLCELCTYTGTGTGTAITFAAAHRVNVSAQYNPTSTVKVNMSAEGAGAIVVASWFVHPQAGVSYQFPLGREFGMAPSAFKGIRLTAPAIVNYVANLWFSE